jgi:hypothetical protein
MLAALTCWVAILVADVPVVPEAAAMPQLSVAELQLLGTVLARAKLSEMLLPREMRSTFGIPVEPPDAPEYLAGRSLELFSARTVPGEATLRPAQRQRAQELLQQMGLVILPKALPGKVVDAMRNRTLAAVGARKYPFSTIVESEFRKDIPMEFDSGDAAADADVRAWLDATVAVVGPVLRDVLGGDGQLSEFSGLVSFPGAKRQREHSDTVVTKADDLEDGLLFTVFVSLDDTDVEMGALDLWPGTHTTWPFTSLQTVLNASLAPLPALRMALPKGSVVVMNSRTRHCGTANTTPRTRAVAYVSLFEARGGSKELPRQTTFTMAHRYRERVTLDQLLDRSYAQRTYDDDNGGESSTKTTISYSALGPAFDVFTGNQGVLDWAQAQALGHQLALNVSGAGSDELNGWYYYSGEHNDAAQFEMKRDGRTFEVFKVQGSSWWNLHEVLRRDGSTAYRTLYGSEGRSSNERLPPSGGWDEGQLDNWVGALPDPSIELVRVAVREFVRDGLTRGTYEAAGSWHTSGLHEYALKVAGAGSDELNGWYYYSGEHNDAAQFEMKRDGRTFEVFKVKGSSWWNLHEVLRRDGAATYSTLYGCAGKAVLTREPPSRGWGEGHLDGWLGVLPGPSIELVRVAVGSFVRAELKTGKYEPVRAGSNDDRRRRRRRSRGRETRQPASLQNAQREDL